MNNNIVLIPVEIDELLQKFREVVKAEIAVKQTEEIEARLLSPASACKLFSPTISRVTLSAWTKAGYLREHRISNKIFYKTNEIIEAAKHLKKYKRSV